jgi:peptidoglycan-associated lipoprotein
MNRMTRTLSAMLTVVAVVAACHQAPPAAAPAPTVNQDSLDRERARQDSISRAEAARRDSAARAQAAADSARRMQEQMSAGALAALQAAVYFQYDSDVLTDSARGALDTKASILNANTSLRLRIAGNTDERGSDEYNIALGQRRAAAAKRYLVQRGIDDARIEVISYGEERPADPGHEEPSWAKNRRDDFEVLNASGLVTMPRSQ